jgi:ABC-type nitrate/sulfonate/bicarbonate transport system ATPase subunit
MKYEIKDTILYLENISVAYDGKTIIKDINLCEKDVISAGKVVGQTIAVVGRSGRGKSTLFKVLTGLVKPTTGKVLIADVNSDIQDDAKIVSEGDVGFVDQKYTLFRHKTIQQIFNFALRNKKISKEDKNKMIDQYLTEWGLFEHKDKYSNELSGGQRQRVSIVEQLLSSGHFMVFDEPFSGLDVLNIESVKNAFSTIQKSHELNTIIFSTHDINLAVELADSIYVIGHKDDCKDYSTIVKHYDLKEMGLAWEEFGVNHLNLVKELKEVLASS